VSPSLVAVKQCQSVHLYRKKYEHFMASYWYCKSGVCNKTVWIRTKHVTTRWQEECVEAEYRRQNHRI